MRTFLMETDIGLLYGMYVCFPMYRGGEGVGENVNTLGFYGLDAALTEFGERDAVGRVLIRHDDPLFLFGSMSKSLCIVAKRRSFRAY